MKIETVKDVIEAITIRNYLKMMMDAGFPVSKEEVKELNTISAQMDKDICKSILKMNSEPIVGSENPFYKLKTEVNGTSKVITADMDLNPDKILWTNTSMKSIDQLQTAVNRLPKEKRPYKRRDTVPVTELQDKEIEKATKDLDKDSALSVKNEMLENIQKENKIKKPTFRRVTDEQSELPIDPNITFDK